MIRKILGNPALPGKQRVHVVYNIVRSLITLAQDKNIPLQYLQPGTENEVIGLEMQGANFVLRHGNVDPTTRRDDAVILYNHDEHFNTSQNWENGGTSLELGLTRTLVHFNYAMEHLHHQYRNAITSRCLAAGDKIRTKLNLSRRKNPLKSLLNARTRSNFDFEVTERIRGREV